MGGTILPPGPPVAPPPAAPPPIAPAPAAQGGGVQPAVAAAPVPPDWRQPSFDFLADSTKQLITVATGVVTATVLFSKDIDPTSKRWALAAWVVLTLSVISGISVLFNMSGSLHSAAEGKDPAPSVMAEGIPFFSKCQIVTFVIGIVLVMAFGLFAKPIPSLSVEPKQPIVVTCVAPPAPPVKEFSGKPTDTTKKGSVKKQSKKTKP